MANEAVSERFADAAAESPRLWPDLQALCGLGGRFAGSESEARALDFLAGRLREIGGTDPLEHAVDYDGWVRGDCALEVAGGPRLRCESLVRSTTTPPGGLQAEVLDLGRGSEDDFRRHAGQIPGRIVLVRHEYMFSPHTVHRRHKARMAIERGAAGFLIAGTLPGDLPVTGSAEYSLDRGIPAAGIGAEGAAHLASGNGRCVQVCLQVEAETRPARTHNLLLELPGRSDEWVVLCAHLDGHHLAQSAMDNATGVAAVLAVAEALAPQVAGFRRGLRLALFTVEEWALYGSQVYVDALSPAERDAIALVLNLDSVAGSPRLTALTSEFDAAHAFLQQTAQANGFTLGSHRPLRANSDHYNFARHGIPAVRLVAGFDEPESALRYLLTPGDVIERVAPRDLQGAVRLAATLAHAACTVPSLALRNQAE